MIKVAAALAESSIDFQHRLGAVITNRKGTIISSGVNVRKTHPVQARHARFINPDACFLHAEISALVKCREKPHTLYVARILRDGTTALAKPCPICQLAIKEAEIDTVVYTTGSENKFESIKVINLN